MKNLANTMYIIVTVLLTLIYASCKNSSEPKVEIKIDKTAMQTLQGTWINDINGSIVFMFKGDSVYYNDSLSRPTKFHVYADTLYISNHPVTAYPIISLNNDEFCFINHLGEEVLLTKSSSDVKTTLHGEYKGLVSVNQNKVIKRDTVMVFNEEHYHAYTQVNPTSYKVYKQEANSDGIMVESVYYDNIVHIALYNGNKKVYSSNITKSDFVKHVPQAYLDKAILSEIGFGGIDERGVTFIAIISIPDSYTNYRIKINIDKDGKKTLSV